MIGMGSARGLKPFPLLFLDALEALSSACHLNLRRSLGTPCPTLPGATPIANRISSDALVPSMARKVIVVTPVKVKRVMIAGRCSCGQRLLKGMIRCPGCGAAIAKQ